MNYEGTLFQTVNIILNIVYYFVIVKDKKV